MPLEFIATTALLLLSLLVMLLMIGEFRRARRKYEQLVGTLSEEEDATGREWFSSSLITAYVFCMLLVSVAGYLPIIFLW